MKRIYIFIQAFLLIVVIASCNGPKKVAEKPADTKSEVKPTDVVAVDKANPTDDSKKAKKTFDSMTGDKIIENASSRINNKVGLNDQQKKSVDDILTKNFLGMGEDLMKEYTGEQVKTLSRSLIEKSQDSIMLILDESQKEKLKSFGQH